MRKATLLSHIFFTLALSMTVGCAANTSEPASARSTGAATGSPGASRADRGTGPAAAGSKGIPGSTAAGDTGGGTALTIDSSYSTRATDCTGRDVVVEGQAGAIGLTGRCGTVTIDGRFNTVTVETADTIRVTGNSSTVIAKTVGAIQLDGSVFDTVRWVGGTDGKEPTVSGNCRSCTVAQISGQEYGHRTRP